MTTSIDMSFADLEDVLLPAAPASSTLMVTSFDPGEASVVAAPIDLGTANYVSPALAVSDVAPASDVIAAGAPSEAAAALATDTTAIDTLITIDDGAMLVDPAICRIRPDDLTDGFEIPAVDATTLPADGDQIIWIDDGANFGGDPSIDIAGPLPPIDGCDQIIWIDDGAYFDVDPVLDIADFSPPVDDGAFGPVTIMPIDVEIGDALTLPDANTDSSDLTELTVPYDPTDVIGTVEPICVICPIDPAFFPSFDQGEGGDIAICIMPVEDTFVADTGPVAIDFAVASTDLAASAGVAI